MSQPTSHSLDFCTLKTVNDILLDSHLAILSALAPCT